MKATFKMSPLFTAYAIANGLDCERLNQSAESVLNERKVASQESSGMKFIKKDMRAESSETVTYTQVACVVTAFIQYAEDEVGTLAKTAAKAEKLGFAPLVLESIPATVHGQDIAPWLAKHRVVTDADKAAKDAKDKQEAKDAIEATKKQVAAKSAKTVAA